jgi:hypothetical protein
VILACNACRKFPSTAFEQRSVRLARCTVLTATEDALPARPLNRPTQLKSLHDASFNLGPPALRILRSGVNQLFHVGSCNHSSSKFASERSARSLDWVPIHTRTWYLLVPCSLSMKSVCADYLAIATTYYYPVGQI